VFSGCSQGDLSARVHHAPSLTYGILSLFSRGKGNGGGRYQAPPNGQLGSSRFRRWSRSLTDVHSEGLSLEISSDMHAAPTAKRDPLTASCDL
jgi:hypothetical protein